MTSGSEKRSTIRRSVSAEGRRLLALFDGPLNRFIVLVAILGALSFAGLLVAFGPEPWPVLPWLILTAACAVLVSFPYRVSRPGTSYYIDFDEILLVLSLLFLSPPGTVAVLVLGYLGGASAAGTSLKRVTFNVGARTTAVSGSLALHSLLPLELTSPGHFVVSALVVTLSYTLINQLLVSQVVALLSGTSFRRELSHACLHEIPQTWPVVVGYGILLGLATMETPLAWLVGAVPLVMMVSSSRQSQQRKDEHQRMRGLYGAAQRMHEANTDTEVLKVLRESVLATLGVEGTTLRADPPVGEELGAWLPNRRVWAIVPRPVTPAMRRQDEAFLQALASLVDAGMERATMVGELERQSLRDPLTNAYNRRYFHQALAAALDRGEEQPGCLALIDIDYFKVINDTYGHEVGDNALKGLVAEVESVFRSNDVLCRMGGDEFALILPGLTPELALDRLERLRERLAEVRPGDPGAGPAGFRTSMGLAAYPLHGREPSLLLRAADHALYRAKREGRNRVILAGEPVRALTGAG